MKPKFQIATVIFILSIFSTRIQAADYYWVGGTGNWSDLNHWATTSGGAIHPGAIPDSTTNVYFDVNSFPSAGAVVTTDLQVVSCLNFDWTGALNNPTFSRSAAFGTASLMIYGSLILNPGLTFNYFYTGVNPIQILLLSSTTGNVIDMAGVIFSDRLYVIIGSAAATGEYTLLSDYSQPQQYGHFIISNGVFNSNGFDITGGYIEINTGAGQVNLNNSTINCDTYYEKNTSLVPGNPMINCVFFFLYNSTSAYQEVNCQTASIQVSNNNIVELNVATRFNLINSNLNLANIGADVNPDTYIQMVGGHVDKAIIKGQNISFSDTNFYTGDYDTLIFDTPGSTVLLQDSDSLIVNDLLLINANSLDHITIHAPTQGEGNILYGAGILCEDYLELENITALGATQYFAGANSVDLGGNSGWQFASCLFPNVWPGDVNYDLTANNTDILYIGLAFGESGPVRPGASLNWVAQPMTDWTNSFMSGINKKHADCDGNGIVDFADTTAVSINYGFTHPARLANQQSQFNSLNPELKIIATPDSIPPSAHVHADIELGTSAIPVDSIYGLAFTIYYDPTVVNSDSISVDFSNSWLGTVNSDLIGFVKPIVFAGQLDFALCRNDHTNFYGGFGHVASVDVVIEDNISTITNSPIRIGNVYALTSSEYPLSLNTSDDTLFVRPFTSREDYMSMIPIYVYPNPASGKVIIASSASLLTRVELFDLRGNLVFRDDAHATSVLVDVNHIAPGFYNLRCITEKGVYYQKITVE